MDKRELDLRFSLAQIGQLRREVDHVLKERVLYQHFGVQDDIGYGWTDLTDDERKEVVRTFRSYTFVYLLMYVVVPGLIVGFFTVAYYALRLYYPRVASYLASMGSGGSSPVSAFGWETVWVIVTALVGMSIVVLAIRNFQYICIQVARAFVEAVGSSTRRRLCKSAIPPSPILGAWLLAFLMFAMSLVLFFGRAGIPWWAGWLFLLASVSISLGASWAQGQYLAFVTAKWLTFVGEQLAVHSERRGCTEDEMVAGLMKEA